MATAYTRRKRAREAVPAAMPTTEPSAAATQQVPKRALNVGTATLALMDATAAHFAGKRGPVADAWRAWAAIGLVDEEAFLRACERLPPQ